METWLWHLATCMETWVWYLATPLEGQVDAGCRQQVQG